MPIPTSPTLTDCAAIPGVVTDINCAPNTIPGYFDTLFVRDIPFGNEEPSTAFATAIDNASTDSGALRQIPIFDYKLDTGDIPTDKVEGGTLVPAGKATMKHTFRMSNYDNYVNFVRPLGHNKPMFFWLGNASKIMGGEGDWQDGIGGTLTVKPIMDGTGTVTKWELSFTKDVQFLPSYVNTPAGIY